MVSSQANRLSTLAKLWSKLHISEPLVTLQNPWKSSGFGLLQPGQNLIASNTFRNTAKEGQNKKTLHKQDILCKSANCEQKYRNMQINLDICTLTHSQAQTGVCDISLFSFSKRETFLSFLSAKSQYPLLTTNKHFTIKGKSSAHKFD